MRIDAEMEMYPLLEHSLSNYLNSLNRAITIGKIHM